MNRKVLSILTAGLLLFGGGVKASEQIEQIAKEAISSLTSTISDPSLKGVAIWNIKDPTGSVDTVKLKDELTYHLVKTKRFKVVQRDILANALKEIDLEIASDVSDYFDQNTTRRFSEVQPIDGLIFGEVYPGGVTGAEPPRLILRMLDIEKQRLVWAKELPLTPSKDHLLDEMVDKTIEDLEEQGTFIKKAGVDLENVAKNAVSSMVRTVKDPDLKHLGILSIQDETGKVDTEELGEILTYELVNDGRFQVVERGLLDELIKEIEYEKESGYFDQKKANQYGGIKGIDGLLVGRVYQTEFEDEKRPILILKLLDLEHQYLVWAAEINLSEEEMPFKTTDVISSSIKDAENRLKERGINRIALWNISNNTELKLNKPLLIDKLTANLVAKTGLTVIDRGNIEELYKEKGLAEKYYLWVDQETASRLGKGYGINAFIYGAIYENPILHKKNPSLILKMVDIEKGILVWAKEVPLTEDYLETGVDRAVLDLVNNLKKTESGLDVKRVSLLQFVDETTEKRIDDRAVVDKMITKMVEELSLEMVDRESLEAFKGEIQLTEEGVLNKQTMAKKGESRGIEAFIYGKLTQSSEELEKNQVAYRTRLLVSLINVGSVATVAMEKGVGEKIITEDI